MATANDTSGAPGSDTIREIAGEPVRTLDTFEPAGSALLVKSPDMFDRIVEIGREAHAVDLVELNLPEPVHGLPGKLQVVIKHGPSGAKIDPIRALFKEFETAPERRKGKAVVTTLQAFIDLTKRHQDEDSAIFAQTIWPTPKLTAILNYHRKPSDDTIVEDGDKTARYGDHRVEYVFPVTDEFKAWMDKNEIGMEQGDFAAFLEDHVDELTAPMDQERSDYERLFKEKMAIPTEIVALSRDLEIHVGHKVKRKERLQSGERSVVFESEHMNERGEPVEIPGVFMISVPAFVDGEPIRIPARLRYRLKAGDIIWFYQLYRPEKWLRAQVQNDLDEAREATGLPAYEGAPEA